MTSVQQPLMGEALAKVLRVFSIHAAKFKGTGLPRISDAMRRRYQRRWRGGEIRIDDFQADVSISVDLRDHMGSRIFWFDAYSEPELNLLNRLLSQGDVFIDIGANIGEFTLPAARTVGPTGRVIAFEPVPAIRARLERHVEWNDWANVTIAPEAIGDREGNVRLYGQAPTADEKHEGLPTMFASDERPVQIADVPMTTLDSKVKRLGLTRVDGIKIDIEGAELPALHGATATLRRFKPWLLCEIGANTCEAAGYQPWDLAEFLLSLGYRLEAIDGDRLRPIMKEADLRDWQNVLARPQ